MFENKFYMTDPTVVSPDLSLRSVYISVLATIPFPVDLRVLLSFDHMTSVSPSNYDPFLIVLFCI